MANSIRIHLLVVLVLVATPPRATLAAEAPEPTAFVYHQRLIYLTANVNGTDGLLLLLDTGASASAFDDETTARLRLPLLGTSTVEGTAGSIDVRTARVDRISIGAATCRDLIVTVYDLGGLLSPEGAHLDGILGYDFLRHFSVEVDFKRRVIAFSGRSEPSRPGRTSAPFELDNGIPRLAGRLDGTVAADLRLDTGASLFETEDFYVNITERIWARLKARNPRLTSERFLLGTGVGGEVKLPVARIERLTLGGTTVKAPYVIVQPKAGYFARADSVGFVSNNLLEKFSPVTIDYLGRRLHLTR